MQKELNIRENYTGRRLNENSCFIYILQPVDIVYFGMISIHLVKIIF